MKKVVSFILALLMIFAFAACSNEETPNTNEQTNNQQNNESNESAEVQEEVNEITVMWADAPMTLDPVYSSDMYGDNLFELIFDRLVGYNSDYELTPGIAKSWEMIDEYTWLFHLQENAYFQDGEQVTAEDVKYTFDRTADPEVNCIGNYAYAYPSIYLKECTIIDDFTVQFTTEQPVVLFVDWMKEFFIFPKHYYETNDFDYFTMNPMGSGPYKLVEWKMGEHIIVERDDNYWQDTYRGYIDKITFKFAEEAATRAAELVTGNVDIVDKLNFSLQQTVEDNGANFVIKESGTRQYIGFTQYGHPALQIKEVRQAINYALDFDTMAATLLNGYGVGQRMASMVPAPVTSDKVTAYTYNPEKAVELLAQAGYKDLDGDSFVEDADGNALELLMYTPSGHYVQDKEIAQVVASYIEKIGVKCSVELVEWGSYCDAMDAKALTCDLFFIGSGPAFSVSGDTTDLYAYSSANYGDWVNDEYTALYDELSGCFDKARQQELSDALQLLVQEEAPILFLYYPPLFYGVSDRVEWEPMSNGRTFLREAKVIGYNYGK